MKFRPRWKRRRLFDVPLYAIPHPRCPGRGVQRVYRFRNDYGASVISYEPEARAKWELAVVRFLSKRIDHFEIAWNITWNIAATGEISQDLTIKDVERLLREIKKLRRRKRRIICPDLRIEGEEK